MARPGGQSSSRKARQIDLHHRGDRRAIMVVIAAGSGSVVRRRAALATTRTGSSASKRGDIPLEGWIGARPTASPSHAEREGYPIGRAGAPGAGELGGMDARTRSAAFGVRSAAGDIVHSSKLDGGCSQTPAHRRVSRRRSCASLHPSPSAISPSRVRAVGSGVAQFAAF